VRNVRNIIFNDTVYATLVTFEEVANARIHNRDRNLKPCS
jgi:hypothetical protein